MPPFFDAGTGPFFFPCVRKGAGLPDFSWFNIPKQALMYPKQSKMYQNGGKYTNVFHCKTLPKCTQIGIFVLKIYHLAILLGRSIFNRLCN
jgi:hypothetical protein